MPLITAIHGGGDWYDASVNFLILPDNIDFKTEQEKYWRWYYEEYCPILRERKTHGGRLPTYMSLVEWLKQAGAREPTEAELVVVWDDPL